MLETAEAPPSGQLQSIEALRRVLDRHYERLAGDGEVQGKPSSQVRFKADQELPPAAEGIESPYDLDPRFRRRYQTAWTGYLVHLSESCDADQVHLITHVETTVATVHESQKTETIHQALVDKELPPEQHLVDAAYIDAELLVSSREDFAITLLGPGRPDNS